MIKLSYEQQIAFNSLSIIAGNALYALTVVLFLVPSGLITGGATGIALGVNRVLGLPVSGVLFAINMTMLTVGWVLLGRRFAITTIASTILSPCFWPCGSGCLQILCSPMIWCSTPSLPVWAWAFRWASPSGQAHPPAAWTSLRWC